MSSSSTAMTLSNLKYEADKIPLGHDRAFVAFIEKELPTIETPDIPHSAENSIKFELLCRLWVSLGADERVEQKIKVFMNEPQFMQQVKLEEGGCATQYLFAYAMFMQLNGDEDESVRILKLLKAQHLKNRLFEVNLRLSAVKRWKRWLWLPHTLLSISLFLLFVTKDQFSAVVRLIIAGFGLLSAGVGLGYYVYARYLMKQAKKLGSEWFQQWDEKIERE